MSQVRQDSPRLDVANERLHHIVSAMPVLLDAFDEQNNIIAWNAECERVTGYTAQEMIGNPDALRLLYPDDEYRAWMLETVAQQSGDFRNQEFELTAKNGEKRTVAWSNFSGSTPIQGWAAWAIGVDVTERKSAGEALRQSEEMMRYIIKHDPNALAVYDKDLHYIAVSDRYLHDYGVREEDILGKHHYEVFPEMPERWKEVHRRVLAGATERNDDDCFERPDGAVTYNRWECRPWYKADGAIGGMITYTEVTTERKRAEEALRQSEEKYRALYENAPLAYQSLDKDGCFLDINPAWLQTLGYEREEVIGKCFADFLPPEQRPAFERNFPALKKSGHRSGVEFRLRHKTGRWVDVTFEARSGYHPDGSFRQTYCVFQDITERKKAEAELAEANLRLQEAVAAGNVGLWDWDLKSNTVRYSAEWKRQIGYGDDEIGDDFEEWRSRVHPDDLGKTEDAVKAFIEEKRSGYQVEFRFRHKDGSYRWILAQASVLCDESGEPARVMGSHVDITAQKQAEEERRKSEDAYRNLFDHMLDGFAAHEMIYDDAGRAVDYRFLAVNPAFEKLTGLKAADIVGKTVLEVLPCTEAHWIETYGKVAETGEPIRFDNVSRELGKHYIVSAFRTEPGKFACLFQDISELKRTEKQLREREVQLTQAQEIAHIGSWSYDVAADKPTWSAEVYRIFGRDAALGEPSWEEHREHIHPDDWTRLDHAVRESMEHGTPYVIEYRTAHPDGEMHWARTHGEGIKDENGAVVSLHGTVQDITEAKQMEERLRQMEKMDAIGQLAGGVAHDFNNQLGGIMGYADMLESRLEDPELRRYAENVVIGARRAADLTEKLLAFARKGQYVSTVVNVHEILGEVVGILSHSVNKKIEIKQILAASPPTVRGDPAQLQSALLNLGLNACDAMPDGGELIFATEHADLDAEYCASLPYDIEPGTYLSVSVTDSGCGISREHQNRIFEPFFTTKAVGKGTGMGLAAVYGTVKHHGGAINLYSEPGRGTTFRLFLPLTRDESATMPLGAQPLAAPRTATLLVVEDEPMLRNLAEDMLEALGYGVVTAADGQEGVAHYREHWREIDLVILDMMMPNMDGPEAYRAMKAINPEVKVLLASGYSLDGAAQDLIDEGVSGFLQKPFNCAELSAKAAEVLGE